MPQVEEFKSFLILDKNSEETQNLDKLSKINIFVWPNNSWKSRFLRGIAKIKDYKFIYEKDKAISINIELEKIIQQYSEIRKIHSNVVNYKINWQIIQDDVISKLHINYFDKDLVSNVVFIKDFLLKSKTWSYEINTYRWSWSIEWMTNDIKKLLSNNTIFDLLEEFNREFIDFKKCYIPILRSLNYINKYVEGDHKSSDHFQLRITENYEFNKWTDNVDIFSWQLLYNRVRSMLLWEKDERDRMRSYEKFLSSYFFDQEEISLIPKENSDVLHIKIWTEERPIYKLWDWIQSLIIITFPIFESDNCLFFIEEPELYLHPWMQRKLIEVLINAEQTKWHQFFITTHSNNFLDLTLDFDNISIFKARKTEDKKFIIENIKAWDENILLDLWVQKSSVFLSNSTIRVEGITDRLYLNKYLQLYQEHKKQVDEGFVEVKQDVDYCFVEYWGNNITHFSFLDDQPHEQVNVDRLCAKSLLIIDEDWEGRKKDRKEKLEEKLGKRYNKLSVREIENLLSLDVIKNAVTELEKECWNQSVEFKTRIWDHRKTPLGKFIEEKLLVAKMKTTYKAKSWTIRNKVRFYEATIKYINTYDDLSQEAKDVAKTIYDFIIEQKNGS